MTMSFDQRRNRRIFRNRQRDISQRPHRNQRDLVRILVNHLDDEIRTKPRVRLAFRRWQLDVRQPILPVPELRGDQLLIQRMLRPSRDRNVAAPRQRNDLQRILQSLLRVHVAWHYRQRLHFELRRIQSEDDGHGIVGAWIGVDDHAPRCSLRKAHSSESKR